MTDPYDADLCARCGGFFGASIHDPNDERGHGADAHDFESATQEPLPAPVSEVTS